MTFPGDPTAAVAIRGLVRSFRGAAALRGIELEIHRGELFAIIGPDGSGKTTLIQSICAILDPAQYAVWHVPIIGGRKPMH